MGKLRMYFLNFIRLVLILCLSWSSLNLKQASAQLVLEPGPYQGQRDGSEWHLEVSIPKQRVDNAKYQYSLSGEGPGFSNGESRIFTLSGSQPNYNTGGDNDGIIRIYKEEENSGSSNMEMKVINRKKFFLLRLIDRSDTISMEPIEMTKNP